MTGNPVGTEIEQEAVIGGGIMIVRAGIVIDIMIGIADMTVNVIEIQIVPAVMIREVAVGHAQGPESVLGIMIATGACSTLSYRVPTISYCIFGELS